MRPPKVVASQITLASLIIALVLVAGILASYFLAVAATRDSNHRWCSTLTLLTSHPVPKPADSAANPSREDAYLFYIHLKALEHDFGCP